ncbi:MAG: SMC family ATPase [Lachnospiraceae bacterium]|nr:SMC family ATPase [Lachnospiraceae bacterium]
MKPLVIEMSAFGPYAEKTVIHLYEMSGQGLFLITGDTGAGKTTIFDAIAFALFGEASGLVRTADTLRSDFADASVKTYVELTFSHRNKIYTVRRNPRYNRPKKSGEGLTTENADAELKLPEGDIITGYREVTARIASILGITYMQFKQIAMIAQGEFIQLLLADSKDRGDIFRRIFNTDIFQQFQRLFKEKERELKKSCEAFEQSILQYIASISYSEENWEDIKGQINALSIHDSEEILGLLNQLIQTDKEKKENMALRGGALDKKLSACISLITEAQYINETFEKLEEAFQKKESLDKSIEEHNARKNLLNNGEKALYTVYPLEAEYQRTLKEEKDLKNDISILTDSVDKLSIELKEKQKVYEEEKNKESEREGLSSKIDRLTKSIPQYDRLALLKKEINTIKFKKEELNETLSQLKEKKQKIIEYIDKLNNDLKEMEGIEVQWANCTQKSKELNKELAGLENLKELIKKINVLKNESKDLKNKFINAQKDYDLLNNEYIEKESLFFKEQAGLLAERLKENMPCPVCGSKTHPKKAVLSFDAPKEDELKLLKKKLDDARTYMQNASEKSALKISEITVNSTQLKDLAKGHFDTIDHINSVSEMADMLQAEIAKALEEKQKNDVLALEIEKLIALKEKYKRHLIKSDEAFKSTEEEIHKSEKTYSEIALTLSSKEGELKTLKDTLEYKDKKDAEEKAKAWSLTLSHMKAFFKKSEEEYYEWKNKLERSSAVLSEKIKRLEEVIKLKEIDFKIYINKLKECGFFDEKSYFDSKITQEKIEELKTAIENYINEVRAVNQDILRLSKETENKTKKDIKDLNTQKELLEKEKKGIEEEIHKIVARLGINEPLYHALKKAIPDYLHYQKEYLLVSSLSKTANGELAGKQKIAFEQYVQAAYFSQILIEANKRLSIMTNSRFELLRKKDSADLRSQTGLEIDVMDNYTGRIRSVKSLSGGESFKAALSLALGLSDVIQRYAGGVELDALFIDEGFGALDTESLEQAINTLAGLAEGNRLVGIISHVSELKERIDKQIIIKKHSTGSSIKLISS